MRPLLEVIALGPGDVPGAVEGGADRLEVVAHMDADGLTPDVETVRDVRRACDLPLRVMLRANDGFSTSGSELARLRMAAHRLAEAGADGFVLGFLGLNAEIDVEATLTLAEEFDGRPWTFHRAIDHALDHEEAWNLVPGLPGLDAILTAGSVRGVASGLDELCDRASTSPKAARFDHGWRRTRGRARALAGPGRRPPVPRRQPGAARCFVEGLRRCGAGAFVAAPGGRRRGGGTVRLPNIGGAG